MEDREKYKKLLGSFYGKLITFEEFASDENEDMEFGSNKWQGRYEPIEKMQEMMDLGLAEIMLDLDDHGIDTMFFRIDENTKLKDLMLFIFNEINPDEFSETSENWFRIWWD